MKTLSNLKSILYLSFLLAFTGAIGACTDTGKTEELEELEDLQPKGIVAVTRNVSLSPESVEALLFRVTPSNARFNLEVDSKESAIQLDVRESSHVDVGAGVTSPKHYRLKSIEPSSDGNGGVTEGLYTAYIEDLGTLEAYSDKVALVITAQDDRGGEVRFSSELIEIAATGIESKGTLPTMYLTTPEDPEAPEGRKEINSKEVWVENCEIRIVKGDGSEDLNVSKASLRGRGNSTWGYPKKPFAIKLDKKEEVLGMPRHKRWVLLANWMDRTLMRNSVAFEIARKTSLAWTPRGEFVEVVLNGKHLGNYYLCEHIKVDENRVNIVELDESDTEEPTITGGYLVEMDTYFDEINKFKTSIRQMPVNIKEPDEDVLNSTQMAYIEGYFNRIESILYDQNPPAGESYKDYLDVASFIDWWLVHELTLNGEPNHPKSSFMHKDREGKLFAGPVWDFDWGTFVPGVNDILIKNSIWFDKLFQDADFVAEVKSRWNLLKPEFETVIDYINEEASYIRESAEVNSEMWPITIHVNGDETMSFDQAVNRLRTVYRDRIDLLDRIIDKL